MISGGLAAFKALVPEFDRETGNTVLIGRQPGCRTGGRLPRPCRMKRMVLRKAN
jgi:hypothetical protein